MSERETNPNPGAMGSDHDGDYEINRQIENETHRRASVQEAIRSTREKRELEDVIKPYAEELTKAYGSPVNGIREIFAAARMATQDPASFTQYWAAQHGLNAHHFAGARPPAEVDQMLREAPMQEMEKQADSIIKDLNLKLDELSAPEFNKMTEAIADLRQEGKSPRVAAAIAWERVQHQRRQAKASGSTRSLGDSPSNDRAATIRRAMKSLGFKGR